MAGIADTRADAIRWALTGQRGRPGFGEYCSAFALPVGYSPLLATATRT
jgi:hypothetical protein